MIASILPPRATTVVPSTTARSFDFAGSHLKARRERALRVSASCAAIAAALGLTPAAPAVCSRPEIQTAEQLRLLVETARQRLPSFSVEYTLHEGDDGDEGHMQFGGVWEYAVSDPARVDSSVRQTVRTAAPVEVRAQNGESVPPDVVSWGFDAANDQAYYADEASQLMRVAASGAGVGLSSMANDYEQCTGIAPYSTAAFDGAARADLLQALAEDGAMVLPGTMLWGGYECVVVDVPLVSGGVLAEAGTTFDNRLRYWIAPDLGFAQVAVETFSSGRLRMRRWGADFFETAVGAPCLPMTAGIELIEDGSTDGGESDSAVGKPLTLSVLRAPDGSPRVQWGPDVVVTLEPSVGTRIENLDTGVVRLATAGWGDRAARILAAHGIAGVSGEKSSNGVLFLVGVPLVVAGIGFAVGRSGRASRA